MIDDRAALSHLAAIVMPPSVSWWPPAPGWWILLAAILAGILVLLIAAVRRWQQNAYRREALAELDLLEWDDPASVIAMSAILKRAALAAYPREQIAQLTGGAWLAFLDRTTDADAFSRGTADRSLQAAFGAGTSEGRAFLVAARRWVKRHRVED